jgi:mono/diheme cytochrome c family protein
VCAFPQALQATADGVVVSCRFGRELGLVERGAAGLRSRALVALPGSGRRGLALADDGHTLYVASPPAGGVERVDLRAARGVVQTVATGLAPRRVLVASDPRAPARRLLLVDSYLSHTVTVFALAPDGAIGERLQTIETEAPVQDLAVVPDRGLLLLTHEDRPLDRAEGPVHWLDSVVLRLPRGEATPFLDPGRGRREAVNLTERDGLAQLDAIAIADDGRVAIVGSASDAVLIAPAGAGLPERGHVAAVGAHPSAARFLPDGRLAIADRLSDTVSFVDQAGRAETVALGGPVRTRPWALGELLFYSRALVPKNRADGPLSVYACSACHDEGHIDGRRHPARRNRFRSMTKTCRGLEHTAPYLSLGELDSLDEFADNIIATHSQVDEPYDVTLRRRRGEGWQQVRLGPAEVRRAIADYLGRIPLERSPFADGAALSAEARAGLGVFLQECADCHRPADDAIVGRRPGSLQAIEQAIVAGRLVFTSKGRHDVGTPVLGEGGNNPPSLRGVWAAAPYFSDGTASTLEEVLLRTDPSAERVHDPRNAAHPRFDARTRAALAALLRAL